MAMGVALLVSADPVAIQQLGHALQELSITPEKRGQDAADALHGLTQKMYPDSTSVEYAYDLAIKLQLVSDPTAPRRHAQFGAQSGAQ